MMVLMKEVMEQMRQMKALNLIVNVWFLGSSVMKKSPIPIRMSEWSPYRLVKPVKEYIHAAICKIASDSVPGGTKLVWRPLSASPERRIPRSPVIGRHDHTPRV